MTRYALPSRKGGIALFQLSSHKSKYMSVIVKVIKCR